MFPWWDCCCCCCWDKGPPKSMALLERTHWHGSPSKCFRSLKNFPFPCKPTKLGLSVHSESEIPVHSLRPSDIKVVAAIGNPETPPAPSSGMVNMEKPQSIDSKPQNVCMGIMTDIIRHFNPSVLMPLCSPGKGTAVHTTAEDLWIQAKELVGQLRDNQQLDFEKDWKLITVFFSNTSQCHLCPSTQQCVDSSTRYLICGELAQNRIRLFQSYLFLRIKTVLSALGNRHVPPLAWSIRATTVKRLLARHMEMLWGVLDYLHRGVPRTFVNLVDLSEILAVALHRETGFRSGPTPYPTSITHHAWPILTCSPAPKVCKCLEETTTLSKAVMQWYYEQAWEDLLASSKFNKRESFAVIFQPFFSEIEPPLERSSAQDPTTLALKIWNSMPSQMEPVGRKEESLSSTERKTMKCPSQERPYLFTYKNSKYQASVQLNPEAQIQKKEGSEFTCPDMGPSDSVPTTGLSWSVGGNENIKTVITLPNILREFNPSLKGFSVGTGKENSAAAFFNQAVAGAKSDGLVAQANKLVSLMKADTTINFQEDWKIITVFIGGNDLCASCKDDARFSPQNFVDNIKNALDILHAEVPRAFVNMVKVLEITPLRELYTETTVKCPRFILRQLCPCVLTADDNSPELARLVERNRQYQKETEKLIESGRYDTKDDFTVVLQPFFENVTMPRTPLERVGYKTRYQNFEIETPIMCPNQASPFLSTTKNSNLGHGTWMVCEENAPSTSPPTSVHALRPADIQVVAALGDSLTAGNGIGSQEGDLNDISTQYRGLSFRPVCQVAGGDKSLKNVTTLPNILREFNGNLRGYSVGTGDASSTSAFLNQAVPGAKAEYDIWGSCRKWGGMNLASQVQTLVQKMKNDNRVNFQQDWKVITVMIGATDLCDFCKDSNRYTAANFFDHLRKALDILHKEVPRALVNLVDFLNPSIIWEVFQKNPDRCPVNQASSG
ncbi:Phospholipase B1, membrane-associated [Apodemus speciosus]|uniref:Phospholipase B1, membrane-associated n=1 Tax=Apodemus speciosus TaxID=105296 RepID=A0ABQ0ER32_APOSI